MEKPKLNLDLVEQDGNAFHLMGLFVREAKKAGWTKKEIAEVLEKATSVDYNKLLATLMEV